VKLVIRNGRVICPLTGQDGIADVLIVDGRVAAVGERLDAPGAESFDATGLVVAPGFIDMHVHCDELHRRARAAARGGERFPDRRDHAR